MPTLKYRFAIGCRVSRVLDEEPVHGIVTGFQVHGNSDPCYTVTWSGGDESDHFEFELESAREKWAPKEEDA